MACECLDQSQTGDCLKQALSHQNRRPSTHGLPQPRATQIVHKSRASVKNRVFPRPGDCRSLRPDDEWRRWLTCCHHCSSVWVLKMCRHWAYKASDPRNYQNGSTRTECKDLKCLRACNQYCPYNRSVFGSTCTPECLQWGR